MKFLRLHDLDSTEGTVQLRSAGASELILVPHPSASDPNDPLRLPRWRKHLVFGAVCAFTFLTNYALGGLAPAFYILSIEFEKTPAQTSALLLWPILVLGIFNFFWVPVANYVGKRPVFVFASLLLTVAYIWGAAAQTFESLLWSNIVVAFAGSSTEALGAAIVNDIYFLHERSGKLSIYMLAISGGNSIGPLICGFITETIGWRWHKWIAAIFTGVNFLVVLFFVPETRYDRDFSSSLKTQSSDDQLRHCGSTAADEKLIKVAKVLTDRSPSSSPEPLAETPQVRQKSYTQQLKLWSGTPNSISLVGLFLRPLPLILHPVVAYAFLTYAVSLAWVVVINILNPFALQAPPYNFSPAIDGLINIPGFIGNVVGSIAGGFCVDWWCDWRARRSGGVFRPETRLTLLIIPILLVPAGLLLFGYGIAETLSWPAPFIGYGLVSVGLTAAPTITMAYVSDTLLPVAPDALLLVNGLKNVVAFGIIYGVVPWVTTSGYINVFGVQAGVYVGVVGLLGLPLWFMGERVRRSCARWRIVWAGGDAQ